MWTSHWKVGFVWQGQYAKHKWRQVQMLHAPVAKIGNANPEHKTGCSLRRLFMWTSPQNIIRVTRVLKCPMFSPAGSRFGPIIISAVFWHCRITCEPVHGPRFAARFDWVLGLWPWTENQQQLAALGPTSGQHCAITSSDPVLLDHYFGFLGQKSTYG